MNQLPSRLIYQLTLVDQLPRSKQSRLRGYTLLSLALLTALLVSDTTFDLVDLNQGLVIGSILILIGIYTELWMTHLYTNSAYYRGLRSYTGSGNYREAGFTFEAAEILWRGKDDLTQALLSSTFGVHIYVRAELTSDIIEAFLASPRTHVPAASMALAPDRPTTLVDIVDAVLILDTRFVKLLDSNGVTPDTFRGSARSVMNAYYERKRSERWWSRDVLSRSRALGRSLSISAAINNLPYTHHYREARVEPTHIERRIVRDINVHLQSQRDSNVLLVAEDSITITALCEQLSRHLSSGGIGTLNNVYLATIDHDSILGSGFDALTIETTLRALLQKAARAGSVTFVLTELPTLMQRYATHGVTLAHILDEMLTADRIHILIGATPGERLALQHTYNSLLKRSHEIVAKGFTAADALLDATDVAIQTEASAGHIISFSALERVAEVIASYDTATHETVKRLVTGMSAHYHTEKIITKDLASRYLAHELNIAVGPVDADEREVLLYLEDIMHKTIVGQSRAVKAIGSTLRRARVELTPTTKPLASFLFLGPTGVGKTETAKALAHLYLKDASAFVRFDMSEFSTEDTLFTLLGTESAPGRLTDEVRNHPRCVIVLDEFEKAHKVVRNLFLQILDEGMFTNGQGQHVSLRGTIIIATSNAGSSLIANTTQKRRQSPTLDSEIIDHVIREKQLSPELIGRFDDIIIFDALNTNELRVIAEQEILKLATQLKERGYELVVTNDALTAILSSTASATFGARALRHTMAEIIGDCIATRIIKGAVRPGDTITISESEVEAKLAR